MKKLLATFMISCVLLAGFCLPSCKKEEKHTGRYEINAEYREEARAVSGTVKVTFYNSYATELDELKFNLYPNAYRKNALYPAVSEGEREMAYYGGESYGEITITSVNGGKGWSIEGVDENILSVSLIKPISKGGEIKLDISFVTELASVEHRLGVGKRAVNLAYFYPRLCVYQDGEFVEDECCPFGLPFRSDCAEYKVSLTAPVEYTALGGGMVEAKKVLESKTKYVFELNKARDFACVLAKDIKISATQTKLPSGKSVELRYASFDSEEGNSKMLQTIQTAMQYLSKLFGEYPYPALSVISTGSSIESLANTGVVFLSDSLSEKERVQATVKEIARQWWGKSVGSDDVNEGWQSEALSEYSAVVFFENYESYGIGRYEFVKKRLEEYRSFFTVYGSVFGGVDTSMNRPLKSYSSGYEYKCITRDKGVVMFDTLRKSVGDRNFFKALKYYYEKNAYSNVKPIAMYESFEKCGVDASGFFQSFVTGKAVI